MFNVIGVAHFNVKTAEYSTVMQLEVSQTSSAN